MKILVIGAGGFAGRYLLEALAFGEGEIFATKLPNEEIPVSGVTSFNLDITDSAATAALIAEISPDEIYHLAAQSSAALSWKCPQLTFEINLIGVLNVLEGVRVIEKICRILLIGSSEEYGIVSVDKIPIKEEAAVHPQNPYAVSKLAQNLLGGLYVKAYEMEIISVRAFNHIGPRQSKDFVVADFCRQTARIEKGLQGTAIKVGNLSAVRDFTDARDVVRAYILLMEKGKIGETYNVGGGTVCEISQILERILAFSDMKISVEFDKERFRPIDAPRISADISKLQADTGWKPIYSLNETLLDTLTYWRDELSQSDEPERI